MSSWERLIMSEVFTLEMAIEYLDTKEDPEIIKLICKRLPKYHTTNLEFYLPQFLTLCLTRADDMGYLREFVIATCSRHSHFALLSSWHLQAELDGAREFSRQTQIARLLHDVNMATLRLGADDAAEALGDASDSVDGSGDREQQPLHPAMRRDSSPPNCAPTEAIMPANKLYHKALEDEKAFIRRLTDLGESLRIYRDKVSRRAHLFSELVNINMTLPARIYLPMNVCPEDVSGQQQPDSSTTAGDGTKRHASVVNAEISSHALTSHHIVRLPPEEAVVLNSKDKAPYMLQVEVVECNDFYASSLPRKQRIQRKTVHRHRHHHRSRSDGTHVIVPATHRQVTVGQSTLEKACVLPLSSSLASEELPQECEPVDKANSDGNAARDQHAHTSLARGSVVRSIGATRGHSSSPLGQRASAPAPLSISTTGNQFDTSPKQQQQRQQPRQLGQKDERGADGDEGGMVVESHAYSFKATSAHVRRHSSASAQFELTQTEEAWYATRGQASLPVGNLPDGRHQQHQQPPSKHPLSASHITDMPHRTSRDIFFPDTESGETISTVGNTQSFSSESGCTYLHSSRSLSSFSHVHSHHDSTTSLADQMLQSQLPDSSTGYLERSRSSGVSPATMIGVSTVTTTTETMTPPTQSVNATTNPLPSPLIGENGGNIIAPTGGVFYWSRPGSASQSNVHSPSTSRATSQVHSRVQSITGRVLSDNAVAVQQQREEDASSDRGANSDLVVDTANGDGSANAETASECQEASLATQPGDHADEDSGVGTNDQPTTYRKKPPSSDGLPSHDVADPMIQDVPSSNGSEGEGTVASNEGERSSNANMAVLSIRKRLHHASSTPESRFRMTQTDPSAIKAKENWAAKARRIRSLSPYGHLPSWRLVPVIVKSGDDLRQEVLAAQLLALFQKVWQQEGLELWLRPLQILVTSINGGMLEVVGSAVSLHQTKKQQGDTLLSYFEQQYGPAGSASFVAAQDNFVRSLAAYSLFTYFAQVKDRHNGNILIDAQGHVMHIDFGFFLSNSPGRNIGFETAPFKLLDDFVAVMGGRDGEPFGRFKELLFQGFLCARKHSAAFVTLLNIMARDSNLPCFIKASAVQDFRNRFLEGKTDAALKTHIEMLVKKSLGNTRTRLYDNFQYYTNGIL